MEGKDNIKELFSEKLGNFEANVNPELWANISSQIGASTATAVGSGLSLAAKIVIGVGVSAAAITTAVLLSSSEVDKPTAIVSKVEKVPNKTEVQTIKSDLKIESDHVINSEQEQNNTLNTSVFDKSNEKSKEVINNPRKQLEVDQLVNDPFRSVGKLPTKTTGEGLKSINENKPEIVQGVQPTTVFRGGKEEEVPSEDPAVVVSEPIKKYANVFTPNSDGINDYFLLESEGLSDFSIVVFNSTGDIVYRSSDSKFRWDGRDIRSGEMVPVGDYMYMVTAYDLNGKPHPIYERLTIAR